MLPAPFARGISIEKLEGGAHMKLISLGAVAGIAAVVCIGSAVPATAATSGAAHPQSVRSNSLSDCWVTASTPSASGNVVSFTASVYCDTVVDYLQAQVSLTTLVGGTVQTIGGDSCTASSTSELSCTATAFCSGGNYYGGFADVVETNATDYTTEATWNQPPVWVACA
jgi:hypothetical protein